MFYFTCNYGLHHSPRRFTADVRLRDIALVLYLSIYFLELCTVAYRIVLTHIQQQGITVTRNTKQHSSVLTELQGFICH